MASKRKKNEARKAKKEGRRESESKSQDCCITLNPKTLEILLSAHARTSQAEGREEYDPQTALW